MKSEFGFTLGSSTLHYVFSKGILKLSNGIAFYADLHNTQIVHSPMCKDWGTKWDQDRWQGHGWKDTGWEIVVTHM